MKVLVCGHRGFIGAHIARALRQAGHEVAGTTSTQPGSGEHLVDFSRDTTPGAWLPRLDGVDAVVNAVGVLRDSARRPMSAVHLLTPMALFTACAQAGVRRVIQISALGIDHGTTPYARTKCAADRHLIERTQAGQLDGLVLRPSVVYGPGGASATLFDRLSLLPWLPLPKAALTSRIQPVHVEDLAAAVVAALSSSAVPKGVLPVVGPQVSSLSAFIQRLRAARGHAPARVMALPERLTIASAAWGDRFPITPWGQQTLALLGTDNTADATPLRDLLGREPRDPASEPAPLATLRTRTA
ncbi:NAD-dependent epimerase/dehydratase family protein [Ideonella sp. DXS29W]|uniref:NAD-dependent epimerase/dehydratase family protein n=1 Tax=Ideonella lacteola TaxID=2984193 RepID=A0ABU9BR58_9BURK